MLKTVPNDEQAPSLYLYQVSTESLPILYHLSPLLAPFNVPNVFVALSCADCGRSFRFQLCLWSLCSFFLIG